MCCRGWREEDSTRCSLRKYSPGLLIKCKGCLDVYKSTQKNSCPMGTKIFAPRTRGDWKTFIDSATPLRSPHWIIDVTRPANGCGGCTRNAMNSANLAQKTWRTADGTPWWLRSTTYNEPNGDYNANCYLDLWHNPQNENSVTWNDGRCIFDWRARAMAKASWEHLIHASWKPSWIPNCSHQVKDQVKGTPN